MPRSRREVFPGEPHHITQRGNNRQTVFMDDEDRHRYLNLLKRGLERHAVKMEAFCLMPNHIHEILIPPSKDALSRCMQEVHLDYARSFNRRYARSGHLWQNRFFSCALDESHLYRAIRYVELNPVRGGLVTEAWEYPWSSAAFHSGLSSIPAAMSNSNSHLAEQLGPWDEYLKGPGLEDERHQIRTCTTRGGKWNT